MIQILDSLEIDVELHDLFLPTWTLWKSAMTIHPWHLNTKSPSPHRFLPPNPRAQHQLHPLQPLRHHRNEDQGRHPRLVRTSPHLVTAGQWCGGNGETCQFPSTLTLISVTLWWRSDVVHSREGSDRSHVATFAKILPARVIFFGSPAYQQLTKTCWLLRPCICQAPHHSPNPKNWLYKGLVIGTRSKKVQHEQVPLVSDDMQCFTSSKGFSLTCRREQTSRLDSEVDHRNLSATNANKSSNWVNQILLYIFISSHL